MNNETPPAIIAPKAPYLDINRFAPVGPLKILPSAWVEARDRLRERIATCVVTHRQEHAHYKSLTETVKTGTLTDTNRPKKSAALNALQASCDRRSTATRTLALAYAFLVGRTHEQVEGTSTCFLHLRDPIAYAVIQVLRGVSQEAKRDSSTWVAIGMHPVAVDPPAITAMVEAWLMATSTAQAKRERETLDARVAATQARIAAHRARLAMRLSETPEQRVARVAKEREERIARRVKG